MTAPQPARSTSSAGDARGSVQPRIWTPPLRELTEDTSFGYDLIDFADAIGWPLDPWQQWLAIHLGELLPDGRPRFRICLVLVARQNGKSVFCRILTLYWMFLEQVPLIIGTNTSRDTAKASWREVIKMAEGIDLLAAELPARHTREAIGEEAFFNAHGSTYRFAAPNSRAGRSFTVHRAILDELRQHLNRDTWDALIPAMNAVADAQAIAITNEGDESAVVLHELYDAAHTYLETGQGDPRLFLAAWSAPAGSDPEDVAALAQANPDLGNRLQLDSLIGLARQAKAAGGETLARFRIEVMCQRIDQLNAAFDPESWRTAGTDQPLDLAQHRRQLALAFDVSLDGQHATLIAAAVVDGLVHVEVVARWQGYGATKALRAELPALVAKLKPRVVAWLPGGPSAAVAAALAEKRGVWPPRRVEVLELRSEVTAICMGAADVLAAGELRHPKDPMLDAHVAQTQRLDQGVQGQWLFARRGSAPIDGSYAMAAAIHAARTLPAAPPPLAVA